jgi:hypothetical protein
MAKSKKVKVESGPASLSEWSEPERQTGTPTMVMFPAKNFQFRVSKKEFKITIPRKGNYHKLAPEVFPEEAGDFMVYDEENSVMYLPAITKILFAVNKYPDLAGNQLFAPIAFLVNDDDVEIIGQVIEMLRPDQISSTAT